MGYFSSGAKAVYHCALCMGAVLTFRVMEVAYQFRMILRMLVKSRLSSFTKPGVENLARWDSSLRSSLVGGWVGGRSGGMGFVSGTWHFLTTLSEAFSRQT